MRKVILLAVLALVAGLASATWGHGISAQAESEGRGGPNGTFVHFSASSGECNTYWMNTSSGLVHEWRYGDPSCPSTGGYSALDLVFKPVSNFEAADCDAGYLSSFKWTFSAAAYTEFADDEGNLTDFLDNGAQYWVCIYPWMD